MTIAEVIASAFRNDGQVWTAAEDLQGIGIAKGDRIPDACQRLCRKRRELGESVRFDFADGSSIITEGGGWDFGIPDSEDFCWLGGGHHGGAGCDEQRENAS